ITTCATTSLCKTRCPVDIDPGAFIHSKKTHQDKRFNHSKAINIAKRKVRLGNITANIIGKSNLHNINQTLHSKFKSKPV
ncbi:hypothetical protein, partial [Francisella tularensis]|uniref:hypothetical protein n=1 Tax=Francisella tularensis TaxID=263 RepID=UPI002381B480